MAQKEAELVRQLLEKTEAKAIPWEPTAQINQFAAAISNVSFTIARFDSTYVLEMRDNQYREMLRISTDEIASGEMQSNLMQLYNSARDSALNVEEAIESLLDNLRKVS